jgi:hypothetical protein
VPKSSRPTLADLTVVLSHLSDRVSAEQGRDLDPIVTVSLQRALLELRRFIPGYETPPDPHAARFFASGARAALEAGLHRDALARALRGLSFAPHDPNLHYLAASACLELGCVRDAVDLLLHTLWIHPGHPEAVRDLEALSALRTDLPAPSEPPACQGGDPLEAWEMVDEIPSGLELEPGEPTDLSIDDLLDALDHGTLPNDLARDERGDEDLSDPDDDLRAA